MNRCGINRANWKSGIIGLSAVIVLALTISAPAYANNLVANGNFAMNGGNGQIGFNTTISGWTLAPIGNNFVPVGNSFLFAPGTADTTGANGVYGVVALWGPGDGSANGLPATSPVGGYFVASDGVFHPAALQQTINGLTVGSNYTLSFYWAAAQQFTLSGPTTEQWQVSLGSQTQSTAVLSNPSHGFSGWQSQSFTYTATSPSELLSFLSVGTPVGVPPMALLDGVALNASTPSVPEPETFTLMATGMIGVAGFARRQYLKKRG